MAESIAQLRALSDSELMQKHDDLAVSTQVGINHYLQELYRRDQNRVADAMLRYTRWLTAMTAIMTAMTVINLAVLV
jgi:hypothetical protein